MGRILLAIVLLWAGAAQAQVGQVVGWPPKQFVAAAASFTGIGDAKSGAIFHGGVIAYNAAQRGQKMLNLCNAGVCADVNSDATTGIVPNAPTINGAPCNNSTHICIGEVYDDSGALACAGGTACNLSLVTGVKVTFVPSASGSIPGLKCEATSNLGSGLITSAHAQPISSGASYSIASAPGAAGTITANGQGENILQGVTTASKPFTYAGTELDQAAAISNNTFVATISSQDGAGNASISTNDGTKTTGAIGANAIGAANSTVSLCSDGFSDHFQGTVLEFFWYPAQLSSGDFTSIVGKMRMNGGF